VGRTPLKITKTLREVSLWVHPEGLVQGALYVSVGDNDQPVEDPHQVMNTSWPFVVLKRSNPNEVRFYNRRSIIRVEYDGVPANQPATTTLHCHLQMMDGSRIDGMIQEVLPPEYSRLYDYLNQADDRFLRIYTDGDKVILLNKAYIIQVTPAP
jgi:hypothetical protein